MRRPSFHGTARNLWAPPAHCCNNGTANFFDRCGPQFLIFIRQQFDMSDAENAGGLMQLGFAHRREFCDRAEISRRTTLTSSGANEFNGETRGGILRDNTASKE